MSRTALSEKKSPRKPLVVPEPAKPKESLRDFAEQIVVAIILAMLIRGFDAEAFVIPTGSMAPTLMGRHKEVNCSQCGYVYAINASDEIDQSVTELQEIAKQRIFQANHAPERLPAAQISYENALRTNDPARIEQATDFLRRAKSEVDNAPRVVDHANKVIKECHEAGICVNCRYRMLVDDSPSFKGDRILVMKFPYELPFLPGSAGPRRWDVVVFHYPNGPETNYIKRLVGLPDEELKIVNGNLLTRPIGSTAPFQIQRKPLFHQKSMQMMVYDDHHQPQALAGKPEWKRWNPTGSWKVLENAGYRVEPSPDSSWSDLRYRHLLPDPEQWAALENKLAPTRAPRPTLITDFYSYNTNINASSYDSWQFTPEGHLQSNWVGDLTVSCRVDLEQVQPGGMVKLELVEAGISNRCEFDVLTGVVSMFHGDKKLAEIGTVLRGVGAHDVEFANVDDRLTLWVDGETIFQDGLPYDDAPDIDDFPTAKDLDPVGIAIKGAKATVSDLVLKRDIYYTQTPSESDYKIPGLRESFESGDAGNGQVLRMYDFLADPSKFPDLKKSSKGEPYVIHSDRYMMMGDNSPRSSDSRFWNDKDARWRGDLERSTWEVPRSMLIGKAFFVYWPHGKPFGPDLRLNHDFRVPFRPYFERMKWIR